MTRARSASGACADCMHFVNAPARIEAMIPGLTTMGSARASVRGEDGICIALDLIVSGRDTCGRFTFASPLDRGLTQDRGQP